jgi:peptidoglycan-N-acetylglucosamine deacetylase
MALAGPNIVHPKSRRATSWRPPPLTAATALLHASASAALVTLPETWPFAIGAIAGNHVLLAFAGLRPRSSLLGPNLTRLPQPAAARGEVALTIDDGPDPAVTPQVLDILDHHGAKASFFCVGDHALRHPDLCREIVRRGHAVENHSQSHSHFFAAFGPRRIAADVDAGQQTLRAITGETPRFFRPTAGLRNLFLDPVLARRGLPLVTWTRRGFDTRERRADVVFERLAHGLGAGDILTLHDGNAARTAAGVPVILEVLPRLLNAIQDAGLRAVTLRSAIP